VHRSLSPTKPLGVRAALLLGAAALVGGCGDRIGSAHGDVLRGGIHYAGGPGPGVLGQQAYQPGTVNLLRDGSTVDVAKLEPGDRFAFSVRPGKYRLSTQLGDLACERDVEVRQAVVVADLVCPVK
jgi:hypothetical protein